MRSSELEKCRTLWVRIELLDREIQFLKLFMIYHTGCLEKYIIQNNSGLQRDDKTTRR